MDDIKLAKIIKYYKHLYREWKSTVGTSGLNLAKKIRHAKNEKQEMTYDGRNGTTK